MSDLISRQKVLFLIDDAWIRGTSLCQADWLIDEIKALSSADRPSGHWINRTMASMQCDQCGYEYDHKGTDAENFCPNCGADMRGGKHE